MHTVIYLLLSKFMDFKQFMPKSFKAAAHLYLTGLQRQKTAAIFEGVIVS